jgi:hypothetical protein
MLLRGPLTPAKRQLKLDDKDIDHRVKDTIAHIAPIRFSRRQQ